MSNKNNIDYSGQTFNGLYINKLHDKTTNNGRSLWECRCYCGNIFYVNIDNIFSGNTRSCGCYRSKDLTGLTFDRLTVLKKLDKRNAFGQILWECKCICGNIKEVGYSNLLRGSVKSCGCLQTDRNKADKTTHGLSNLPEYGIWRNMISRCYNVNDDRYIDYGGRGIKVCDEWLSKDTGIKRFIDDMGFRISLKHTLDRINNDGNYEPSNCKWSSDIDQCNNRRSNVLVIFNDKEYTIGELCRELKINYKLVIGRVRTMKWTIEKSINTYPSESKFIIIKSGEYTYEDFNRLRNNPELVYYIENILKIHNIKYKKFTFYKFIDDMSVVISYW